MGWGLGAWTSSWGYGGSYYNPYYVQPVATAVVPYNYSQPVVVNNYMPAADVAVAGDPSAVAQVPADDPAVAAAQQSFDQGLARFKAGNYRGSSMRSTSPWPNCRAMQWCTKSLR